MSNTRRAEPGNGLRQERYASSPEIERGFNAVLVKLRCETLRNEKDIELAWFLQYLSMLPGGMEKVAADILAIFPERLGTPEMIAIGTASDGIYNADQVRAVRKSSVFSSEGDFLLRGETRTDWDVFTDYAPEHLNDSPGLTATVRAFNQRKAEREKKRAEESKRFPTSYPVTRFLEICREFFNKSVPGLLSQFCLDPGLPVDRLQAVADERYLISIFHDLHGALLEYMARWEKNRLADLIVTTVGKKVLAALDYAESERQLVLVEGPYGTGKTFVIKAWCEARPGKRRYIQAPSSNDNIDFFRTVAAPIGVSRALSLKTQQMRARINEVLQAGHLTVVIDEAHYLFPQASTRVALPGRINWVLTALTNYSVPVALVATPQFTASQIMVEKNTHWASGQFTGRISLYVPLPECLDEADLKALARYHLPNGDEKSIAALVHYSIASRKRIRAIEHTIKSARHLAKEAGRIEVTYADIKAALRESVLPSDSALNQAMTKAADATTAGSRKRPGKMYAAPLQQSLKSISAPVPKRDSGAPLATPDRAKRSPAGLSTA